MNTNIFYGLRLVIAAWLSFSIAVLFGVENAYWAAMPVWVISQQTRGLMYQRGFYRITGTLVGAVIGLAILKITIHPWILISILFITIFVTIFLMRTSHGAKGYAPQMTAVTIVIILIPALFFKQHAWALALSRIECTFIGVIVVTLITSRFTLNEKDTVWYKGLLKWQDTKAYADPGSPKQALCFAAMASTGTLICACVFHLSSWKTGELVTLGVCIFTMALASLQNPYDMALKMLFGVICGVMLAFVYRISIQPYLTNTIVTVVTIIPFFLLGGILRCWKKTAAPALDGNMCFLLASQAGMTSVTTKIALNECLALMLAVALVACTYRVILRPVA
ncbi:FUSC family protein [Raoultella sp. T31]|uniref:FUSC family protein n=1 Tax=Raoultella sp. T31 TaxID=2054594 RepID=UPI000C290BA6|nr:hypothetical protein CWM52_00265 [Raoultella sp. T31]